MSTEGSGERISVSRDTLRAELNELKVDLMDRISEALSTKADATIVAEHDKRISQLEVNAASRLGLPAEIIDLTKRVSALEKFRYAWPSLALLGVVAMFATVAYYLFGATHG